MLESLYPRSSDPAFADAGRELMEQTTRTVIYVICTAWLSAQLLLGTLGNDAISIRLGATLVWLGPAALVALRLLPRRLLLAQAVWLVGLGATIGMATLLYRRPEIALLYALLPFVAVVSAGWRLGLVAEAIATLAVLTLARWPGPWTWSI